MSKPVETNIMDLGLIDIPQTKLGQQKWSYVKGSPSPLPLLNIFTKPTGESFSYSQHQVTSELLQDCHESIATALTREEDDVESLLDKVLTHKQLQEARKVEKHLLHYIFYLQDKVNKLTVDNRELKDGSNKLVRQTQELRHKVDASTAEIRRYKGKASSFHAKLKDCQRKLDIAEENAISEEKKRKAAEQRCVSLKAQLEKKVCIKCKGMDHSLSINKHSENRECNIIEGDDDLAWTANWEFFNDDIFQKASESPAKQIKNKSSKRTSSTRSFDSNHSSKSKQGDNATDLHSPTGVEKVKILFPNSLIQSKAELQHSEHKGLDDRSDIEKQDKDTPEKDRPYLLDDHVLENTAEKSGSMLVKSPRSSPVGCDVVKDRHQNKGLRKSDLVDNLLSRTNIYASPTQVAAVLGKNSKASEKRLAEIRKRRKRNANRN